MYNKIQQACRILKQHKARAPIEVYNRIVHKRRVAQCAAYWKALKGKHKGQRGFVLGNGPSLKVADLDQLRGEICIASNKIYLAYEATDWRPTYWTLADVLLWPKVRAVFAKGDMLIHLADSFFEPDNELSKRIVYWKELPQGLDGDSYKFSSDLASGIFGGCTVTFQNLQIAVHLGLNPIYLIGCDHYYGGEEGADPYGTVVSKTQNHFHPDYRKSGEVVNAAPIDYMNKSYSCARAFTDKYNIEVYNATRGGFLEAFERNDFDDLFPSVIE